MKLGRYTVVRVNDLAMVTTAARFQAQLSAPSRGRFG
jgi:hypothetical protein